jgi:hypothetical protein
VILTGGTMGSMMVAKRPRHPRFARTSSRQSPDDALMRYTAVLTNYHIQLNPLCVEDGDYYKRILSQVIREGKEKKEKTANQQQEYAQR